MSQEFDTLSVTDVMKLLGVSRTTIHRRVKEGKLKPLNEPSPVLERNPNWRFRREEVEKLLHPDKEEQAPEPENKVA